MEDSPSDGEDVQVGSWTFYCGACKQKRTAFMFGSGHVLDLENGQEPDVKNVSVGTDGKFQNIYMILEVRRKEIRESQGGIATIKQLIGTAHADRFHGGGRARVTNNN